MDGFLPRTRQKKTFFTWKTVIFILYICHHILNSTEGFYRRLNLEIIQLFFNIWRKVIFWVRPRNVIHITEALFEQKQIQQKIYNSGILLRKSGNHCYFSTSRRYLPLFCLELLGIFLFFLIADWHFIVETIWTKVRPGQLLWSLDIFTHIFHGSPIVMIQNFHGVVFFAPVISYMERKSFVR